MRKVFVDPVILPEPRFRDGLGIRYVKTAGSDDRVEVLRPLWDVAAMRGSIQNRVARLRSFRQARFVAVRATEVPPDDGSTIEVISEYVAGHRLSEYLEAARNGVVIVDTSAALHIVREVLGALAVLQESRGVTHGAVGPERVLVTPKGRIVVTDYVLGPAIERLDFSRGRLWREFRIPVPPGKHAPRLDEVTDVVQVGVTAVALLAGRPIEGDEYPDEMAGLVASIGQSSDGKGGRSIPVPLLTWLKRALQHDQSGRFANVREARNALEAVLSKQRVATGGASALRILAENFERLAAAADAEAAARAAAEASRGAADMVPGGLGAAGENHARTAGQADPGTVLVPAFTLLPDVAAENFADRDAEPAAGEDAPSPEKPLDPPVGWRVPEPVKPDEPLVASPLIQDAMAAASATEDDFAEEVLDLGELLQDASAESSAIASAEPAAEDAQTSAVAPAPGQQLSPQAHVHLDDLLDLDPWLTAGPAATQAEQPKHPVAEAGAECRAEPCEAAITDLQQAVSPADMPAGASVDLPAASGAGLPVEGPDPAVTEWFGIEEAREVEPPVREVVLSEPSILAEGTPWIPPAQQAAAESGGQLAEIPTDPELLAIELDPALAEWFRTEASVLVVPEATGPEPQADRRAPVETEARPTPAPVRAAPTPLLPPDWLVDVSAAARTPEPPIPPPAPVAPIPPLSTAPPAGREESGPVFTHVAPSVRRVRASAGKRRVARARASLTNTLSAVTGACGQGARRAAAAGGALARGAGRAMYAGASGLGAVLRGILWLIVAALSVLIRGTSTAVRESRRGIGRASRASVRGAVSAARGLTSAARGVTSAARGGAAFTVRAAAATLAVSTRVAGGLSRGLIRSLRALARASAAAGQATGVGLLAAGARMTRALSALAQSTGRGVRAAGTVSAGLGRAGAAGAAHAGSAVAPVLAGTARGAMRLGAVVVATLLTVPRRVFYLAADLVDHVPRSVFKPPFLVVALLVIAGAAGVPYARARWFVAAAKTGTLRIESARPGLTVRIDGISHGLAPLTATVPVGRHRVEIEGAGRVRVHDVDVTAGHDSVVQAAGVVVRATGSIHVTSDPAGAEVWLDGAMYGVSPMTIDDVKEGQHTVLVKDATGSVQQPVRVRAGETASASIGIRPGWLAVFAPVRLDIMEDGRAIGSTEGGRIPAHAGDHALELVGPSIGFRETRRLEVKPGEVTAVTVRLPAVTLEVVAPADAEILIDGQPVGKAPLDPFPVAVGTREIVMRHPTLGERRQVIGVSYGVTNKVVFE
jgi:hypothetical protein